ncbi:MAG: FAD-dependent oxidoreductase [Rhodospirillales bacterium]|jgi:ferredoxin--NADP+ reductase|nr:FAD-dependent oxidoreductase [Rhodospirillales bacterium]
MTISVAIVGTGPSGFYAAQALLESGMDCRIDLIDTLPTPFGLIRGGVAPDHQHTKRVTRTYEQIASQPAVNFYGNVEAGRDITILELRSLYDAVILAIGMPMDRALDLIGGAKKGVYGAAEFVGWYNGHPAYRALDPLLDDRRVAVIGNGNVALDIGRVLCKTRDEMAATDIPDYAVEAIQNAPVTDIFIFGRRGPAEAKFTNVELREIGMLADCAPMVDPEELPDEIPGEMSDRDRRLRMRNIETFRSFSVMDPSGKSKRLHFCFRSMPVEILGNERVEGLRLQRTVIQNGEAVGTGSYYDTPCGTVIAAIGYRMGPLQGVPLDIRRGVVINEDGRVAPGLYVVGWAKRGPTGVISSNKPDGDAIAAHIAADITTAGKLGRAGFEEHLRARNVRWVTFGDWKFIDEAEVAAAQTGAPRKKFVDVEAMIGLVEKERGQTKS